MCLPHQHSLYSDYQRLLDPQLSHCHTPLNEYVLTGICRHPLSTPKPPWCPVTLDILDTLRLSWSHTLQDRRYDAIMLWAAYCVAFFGFLRADEFTCGYRESCSPCMLSLGDVHVDSRESPKVILLQLHHTKTDPFQTGVTVFLRKNSHRICHCVSIPLSTCSNSRMAQLSPKEGCSSRFTRHCKHAERTHWVLLGTGSR